jgi:hypothetical protein
MILADVLKIVFLVLGTLIVFVSYWLAATALFPRTVDRARGAYATRPVRITLIGALVGFPLFVLGAGMVNGAPHPLLKILGGAIAALPILLGLMGSAGLSEKIGLGLVHADDARTPWRRSMRGGVVLSLTFLLPFVGWFVVLPWTVLSGFGAALAALRARHTPEPVVLASAA